MLQIKNTLGGGKPEGLYVWKKYKYNPPVTVSNPSITITCPSTFGNKLNITSADIDIKTLWEDLWSTSSNKDLSRILTDAYGNISEWKSSSGISIGLASSMTSKIGFVSKNGTDGISYLYKDTSIPTYCVFVMGASSNFSVYAGTYTFNGEYKISDSSVEFIDYIVSDKETAYPDGGEKGGYWYEKVVGGISPEMFGLTKMAVDKYTPTAEDNLMTIPHSLGETPKIAILIADKNDVGEYLSSNGTYVYVFFAYMSHMSDNKYPYGYDEGLYTNGTKRYGKLNPIASGSGTNKSSLNETKVIFVFQYTDTTYTYYGYYKKGVEYTLITMA